jgi:hypothetical protein
MEYIGNSFKDKNFEFVNSNEQLRWPIAGVVQIDGIIFWKCISSLSFQGITILYNLSEPDRRWADSLGELC